VAITTAIANSAKLEFLQGIHLAADVYKILLLKAGATGTWDKTATNVGTPGTGAPSTANVGTDEATGTGYTSGGLTLTGYTAALTADTASIDWADAVWAAASISADGAIIYNSTRAGRILQVIAFADTGSVPVTSTNANFTITIPSAGVGQIRIT
jgi:hypothetical protein